MGDIIVKISIAIAAGLFTLQRSKKKSIKYTKKSSLINKLESSNVLTNYHKLLENTLNFLTTRFGASFSADSNNFTTNLAVFYSFAVFFTIWVFNGSGSLGNIEILNPKIEPNIRLALLFVSFCFIYLSYNIFEINNDFYFTRTPTRKKITTVVVYLPYFLVAIFVPLHWTSAIEINSTLRTILIILFSSSLGGFILNRAFFNKSGSLTFAVTYLTLVFGGGMISSILHYSEMPVRMIIMIGLAIIMPLLVYFVNKIFGTNKVYYVNLLMILLSVIIFKFFPKILNMDIISIVLLYFFVLLPSLNGLMDWVSLSVSRIFAKGILKEDEIVKIIFYVLLDLFIAFILLGLLVIIFVLGTKFFNYILVSDQNLQIPIDELIIKTKESPFSSNGLWFIIMLTSTLVPTTFHLFFAINSLTSRYFISARKFFIKRLQEKRTNSATYELLSWYMILQPFAGFMITLTVSVTLIVLVLPFFNNLLGLIAILSTNILK